MDKKYIEAATAILSELDCMCKSVAMPLADHDEMLDALLKISDFAKSAYYRLHGAKCNEDEFRAIVELVNETKKKRWEEESKED